MSKVKDSSDSENTSASRLDNGPHGEELGKYRTPTLEAAPIKGELPNRLYNMHNKTEEGNEAPTSRAMDIIGCSHRSFATNDPSDVSISARWVVGEKADREQ